MKEFIQKVIERRHLTREEAANAMRMITEGKASEAQIAAFLIALRMKDEHPDELLGFVEVMREQSVKVVLEDPDAIDLCGTGGDGSGTFNISTVASFVVAGAGVTVAKHGNRSISSSCGSADVLKALGIDIELAPQDVGTCINTIGIGFLFAPLFHPTMKYAAKPRAELGVKTCFNMLGPLTNPAGVRRQVVGAFNQHAAKKIASVFEQLRTEKIFVVCSDDSMDEVSLHSNTIIHEIEKSRTTEYTLSPESFNLPRTDRASILGGSVEANASIAMSILQGERGPCRDVVIANAAMGLQASGKTHTIEEGVNVAAESIDSKAALRKLQQLKDFKKR